MSVSIQGVQPGSPAQRAGIRPGMRLDYVNGRAIHDGLDYEFATAAPRLALALRHRNGRPLELQVEKDEAEALGLLFDSYLITKHKHCNNRCEFCFIDQMPRGMRKSLYFKDDDERLSFLFGNYVTLTNLTQEELARIIEMRIAPVNISVHTTNPALRAQMMGNAAAGEALAAIPLLAQAGIPMNTQLVLVPGRNDGPELRRSIEWLAQYRPAVQSIAAVPVGLTRHRQRLTHIKAYTPATAAAQLDILLEYGQRFFAETGERLVFPSDEWFLLAGRPIPNEAFYEDYPQLENGVGMWRLLRAEFMDALQQRPAEAGSGRPAAAAGADLATGVLAAPLLAQLAEMAARHNPGAQYHVHTVQNAFFGPGVTVAGLLTGRDIVAQLKGRLRTGRLLLPASVLRAEGDLLLDDTTPAQLQRELGTKISFVQNDGAQLLQALLHGS